ncbi:hypothetical protein C8R47DRAFT_1250722 [Mycena vitilis]|nr:hypothetical protein C8R47DRAFT_1250722 [Mycena vitilis]
MSRFGPRGACAVGDCRPGCVGFVAENPDGSPNYSNFESAEVVCFICGHMWMAHAQNPNLSAQNQRLSRGSAGSGTCAAFYSAETVWNMRMLCVCGLPWVSHLPFTERSSDSSDTSPPAAPLPPPAPAPPSAPTPVAPHRPVTAFSGLARPTTASVQNSRQSIVASVQDQRRASIQRTLHPNDATPAAGPSTTSTTTSPGRRRSGNPRPYTKSPATLPTLDDFALPGAVASTVKLTVAILPKVLDTSPHNDTLDPSPRYAWKGGDDLERAQLQLKRANLVFVVDVDVTGPIFEQIDVGFRVFLQLHNISYVDSSAAASIQTPNTKAWVILGAKGRAGARTWVEDPKCLTRFTFTLQALRNVPFSYTPNYLGEGPIIMIAPRNHNLNGPIDCLFDAPARLPDYVLVHSCLSRRVLHGILASLDGDPTPVCGPLCPPHRNSPPLVRARSPDVYVLTDSDDDDVHFPEAEAMIDEMVRNGLPPLIRTDPGSESVTAAARLAMPTSTIVTRSIHRQQWQDEGVAVAMPISTTAILIPGPLLTSAMEMTSTSNKPRSFDGPGGAMDLTLQHMPGSGQYSLAAWQDHILVPRELEDRVSITARSVDEGARALIVLCFWFFAGRPTGLKFKEVVQEQFVSPRPTVDGVTLGEQAVFGLQVTIGRGIGKGPRNEVVAQAIKILMADGHYWTERETYKTLRLHPSHAPIPLRSCVLKASGFIFLLHFLFVGAPIPVSPFLLSTLFDGRNSASKFDHDFLARFISPSSLSLLKKIAATPLDQPMYASQSEDCIEYQYLVNIPGFDPTMISARRSPAEQDGLCTSVVSFTTLGTIDIESEPDFLAVTDGFNWFATPCREVILITFDRQIKAVADVLSRLDFVETNPENDLWGENAETVAFIIRFFTHYLMEPGHPADPDQVIGALIDDDFDAADPLLRVKLLLSVITGSVLLPIQPSWKVKCLITHDWNQDYPTTDEDGNDDFGPDVTVAFRSCFKTFSITNNARLRQLLVDPNDSAEQGRDTAFGRFVHAQLLACKKSYTDS